MTNAGTRRVPTPISHAARAATLVAAGRGPVTARQARRVILAGKFDFLAVAAIPPLTFAPTFLLSAGNLSPLVVAAALAVVAADAAVMYVAVLGQLTGNAVAGVLDGPAAKRGITADALDVLAGQSPFFKDAVRVLSHPECSPDLVERLYRSTQILSVRTSAVTHPNAPTGLPSLDHIERQVAAEHGILAPHAWAALAADPLPEVRRGVAGNTDADPCTFDILACDPDPTVRDALLARPDVPDNIRAAAALL